MSEVLQRGEKVALGFLCRNACAFAEHSQYLLLAAELARDHIHDPSQPPLWSKSCLLAWLSSSLYTFCLCHSFGRRWCSLRSFLPCLSPRPSPGPSSFPPTAGPDIPWPVSVQLRWHYELNHWLELKTTLKKKKKKTQGGNSFSCHLYWSWCIMKLWSQSKQDN